jgi:quercetin dioxygenase-like cupin family protein
MTSVRHKTRALKCAPLLAACAVVALQFGAVAAFAGSCPAKKVVAADGQRPGPSAHKDVTDTVIASTDLAQEAPKLKDHKFRLRRLVIRPGGVVAWHSHEERPAIIYIISGTVTEYASTCATPIVHKAGDVARETHTTKHWWKNNSKQRVVLLSADILHDKADQKTM